MPTISIILPTYNGSKFISKAIESVITQTYTDWELLIINDGSTDDTKTIVEEYSISNTRIKFIENKNNLGIQKTLNKGISLAQGEYIARLDDDDRWIGNNKLQEQVSFLESNSGYVLVGTDATVGDSNGTIFSKNVMPKNDKDIRNKILSKNCFLHATIMARKEVIEKVGGYSEKKEIRHAEDYDLWLRMGTEGKMANLSLLSTFLIAHDNSLTARNRVVQAKNILSIVKQYRNKYPHFHSGYVISYLRYVGFSVIGVIQIPKKLLYAIQRIYRSI